MDLTLNDDERELLLSILRDRFGTLRQEVYRSETPAFTDELKRTRGTLVEIIHKLEASGGKWAETG